MPYFSFVYPAVLWLLLLLVPIWALALAVPRRLSPLRFWGGLALRTLLLCTLTLSLAGTQLVYGVNQLTTIFLLDSSDSISPSERARGETFIQEALRSKPEDDQAAMVVFGQNALVERAPADSELLGRLTSEPVATHTNIEEAIRLGMALFPADTQKRLVLLSDGGENSGQAVAAAQLAASQDVPIDIVTLSGPASGEEALLADVQAPATVRAGQDIELVVNVESSVDQRATLRVFADEELIVDEVVELAEGSNQFQFRTTVETDDQGFRRYRARIIPRQDNRVQNNEAVVLVQVQGPPRVLLVEGEAGEAAALQNALQAAGMTAEIRAPGEMPDDLASLSAYAAVVLVNVSARDLSVDVMGALPAYVRDLGRGLVMIGGDASYGVGGYSSTPVEEALPVYMDVRNREERPDLALIFVIDKSGSMSACHCSGPNRRTARLTESGDRKLDIAREAVTQASALLGRQDTLGIVAFDTSAHWVLPNTQGAAPADVAEAIGDIMPLGDTNVRAGLRAAEEALQNTSAQIKHVVLLTDGWGRGGDNVDIAGRMYDHGITLSVIAAGSGSADFLEDLAEAGGGRYYASEDMSDVPEIFLQETIFIAGNYLVEQPFLPVVADNSPILKSLGDDLPVLYGYNGSTLKETAQNVLVTDDDSPLLAAWQYGLGRSIAWTSDTRGKWARDWVQWAQFPRFAAQMMGWVLPTGSDQPIETDIRIEGSHIVLNAYVQDDSSEPGQDMQLSAVLLPSQTKENEARGEPFEVMLKQVAPGTYRATLPSPETGTYLVRVRGKEEDGTIQRTVTGLVVPYSSEYRQQQAAPGLLASLRHATSGSELAQPALAFDHADLSEVTRAHEIGLPLLLLVLVILPFDIAVRRLLIQRRDVHAVQNWLLARLRPESRQDSPPVRDDSTQEQVFERLSRAKRRATAAPREPRPLDRQPSPRDEE